MATLTITCPHCSTKVPFNSPYIEVENGQAFKQQCYVCNHTIGIRPHIATDPPAASEVFTKEEVERMRFTRWRIRQECQNQTTKFESYEASFDFRTIKGWSQFLYDLFRKT